MAAPMSLALFSVIFLQISSSYEQVPAFVEGSSDEAASQDSQIREDGVGGESQSVLYDHGSLFTAEEMRPPLQLHDWRPPSPQLSRRKLLQYGGIMPYSPLNVVYNGKTCILFRARKLAIRYRNHTLVDLTQRVFGPDAIVDTRGSFCSKDKATLNIRFGDVEELRGLAIRLQMSNTFYESAGQNWFTLDSVHIHYNWTHEATFNATDVYAPSTNSYHCQHVSSLQKYDTLLVPSSNTDNAANWHITFTDFQIQAFNVHSNKFSSASDCATFFTPAILMGLITSLILLLVLAYALHMVVHLKHIDRYEEHKTTVYFPRSTEAESTEKNNL
ncbi:ATPase H+ transporting accessory protein 1 like a [Ictalurus punctatus]|uniref:ATPase H+ transporting accessory protein 1 like a n=1 Tax=Ictalurus punctatus TaxID=7998 RepID=A0A2D0PHT4_ICTPU|nr:ATPase H+ transporting accessory protein 1 like a [Ictalurus punctatus]